MTFPVVCLMGPTGSGKTQLAVELLKRFPFDIISVDSALVYRGMNIGTAKPDAATLQVAPHRLIDIRDPSEPYSAAQFREDALREMQTIFSKKRLPLLVGGTMLYFKALQQGLAPLPSASIELRKLIHQEGLEKGWQAMHHELEMIDPKASARIHPHDSQRIQRALEVYRLTGKNISTWQAVNQDLAAGFRFINLAIAPKTRAILHERIALRFKKMLEEGLIDEVEQLFHRGDLFLELPAMRSVGYRQVWEFLQKKMTRAEVEEQGIIATRQLAKRQLTWLRSWPDLTWFDSEAPDLMTKVSEFLFSHLRA